MVTIQPGFKAGRHNHPGTVQAADAGRRVHAPIDGQPEKTFKAGQSLEVPSQAIHNEGAVGSVPVKLIAVYIVEKGKPLVNPIK